MPHDVLGIGEHGQELRGHEGGDLDLPHAGRELGRAPRILLLRRENRGEALQSVAHPDFAQRYCLGHVVSPQRPLKTGLRFSLNDAMPSRRSSVVTMRLYASISNSMPSA